MMDKPDYVLDARFLEPPEPFVQTMQMLESLPAEEAMTLLLYREPHPLFRVLRQNGYDYQSELKPDGTFHVTIQKQKA